MVTDIIKCKQCQLYRAVVAVRTLATVMKRERDSKEIVHYINIFFLYNSTKQQLNQCLKRNSRSKEGGWHIKVASAFLLKKIHPLYVHKQ